MKVLIWISLSLGSPVYVWKSCAFPGLLTPAFAAMRRLRRIGFKPVFITMAAGEAAKIIGVDRKSRAFPAHRAAKPQERFVQSGHSPDFTAGQMLAVPIKGFKRAEFASVVR